MRSRLLVVLLLSGCGDAASTIGKGATATAAPCDATECGSAEGECIPSELEAVSLEAGCHLPGADLGCWKAKTCEVGDVYVGDGPETFRLRGCTNIELPTRFAPIQEPGEAPDAPCAVVLPELDEKCRRYSPAECPEEEQCALFPDSRMVDEPETGCQVLEWVDTCLGTLPGIDFGRNIIAVSSLRVCPAE